MRLGVKANNRYFMETQGALDIINICMNTMIKNVNSFNKLRISEM